MRNCAVGLARVHMRMRWLCVVCMRLKSVDILPHLHNSFKHDTPTTACSRSPRQEGVVAPVEAEVGTCDGPHRGGAEHGSPGHWSTAAATATAAAAAAA